MLRIIRIGIIFLFLKTVESRVGVDDDQYFDQESIWRHNGRNARREQSLQRPEELSLDEISQSYQKLKSQNLEVEKLKHFLDKSRSQQTQILQEKNSNEMSQQGSWPYPSSSSDKEQVKWIPNNKMSYEFHINPKTGQRFRKPILSTRLQTQKQITTTTNKNGQSEQDKGERNKNMVGVTGTSQPMMMSNTSETTSNNEMKNSPLSWTIQTRRSHSQRPIVNIFIL